MTGGVATSSAPPTTSVSVAESGTCDLTSSSGVPGQASSSRPPAKRNALPALRRVESSVSRPAATARRAAPRSARPTAATSPHTWAWGKTTVARTDCSHRPAALPSRPASQASIVLGAASGPAPAEVSISPKKAARRTLPGWMGSPSQRPGIREDCSRRVAARSGVRARQAASAAHARA